LEGLVGPRPLGSLEFTERGKPSNLRAMFKEALKGVVEGTEGGIAGLLMDLEGIAVESFTRAGANLDIETVGAEVSVVVKAIQRASEMLEAGDAREVAFKSERMTTLIRVINKGYFVAVALEPEGNLGKGRFLLRVLAPRFAEELAT
jgi:predicted regulator of Ras-like GTPase activity (Roadblock/LC7/MglB family)